MSKLSPNIKLIMTRISLFLLFINCLSSYQSIAQTAFKKITIAEVINIELPESLTLMSDEDMALRYITAKKPLAVYTNPQRTIEFSVNESNTRWELKDLPLMKSFYKASIQNLYDKVKFAQEEIIQVNKRQYVVFEFTSSVKGDKSNLSIRNDVNKYTHILYTIHNGKTYLISFNCPFRERSLWESDIKKAMATVKIR